MFAQRTHWSLTPNAISCLKDNLTRQGEVILDLTESNPTRCGLNYPTEIIQTLADPRNLNYEPSAQGMQRAREAVCEYYQRKNIALNPEQIFLTASTSEGYSFLFRLLGDASDALLSPRPSYPLFEFLAGLNDLQLLTYPLRYDQKWVLDLPQLEAQLKPKVRAMILVNPNNPTGSYVTPEEIQHLSGLAQRHNLAIISDEVFHDFSFNDGKFPSLAAHNECLTFTLGGLSKALGLPQMKISWIVLSGPQSRVAVAQERLEMIADTYLSVNTPSQNALKAWLDLQPVVQSQLLDRIRNNREHLLKILADNPDYKCLNADGGWYAVLLCRESLDEEAFVLQLLAKDKVFIHPGYFFDFDESGYLVLSLLPPADIFQEGISRLLHRLETLKPH